MGNNVWDGLEKGSFVAESENGIVGGSTRCLGPQQLHLPERRGRFWPPKQKGWRMRHHMSLQLSWIELMWLFHRHFKGF